MLTNEVSSENAGIHSVPTPPLLILVISLLLFHLLEQLCEQSITIASVHFAIGLVLRCLEPVEADLDSVLCARLLLTL